MALTKVWALAQLRTAYKEPVKVVANSQFELTGANQPAPVVDGVGLPSGPSPGLTYRVLLAGQTDPKENGLYDVTVVDAATDADWSSVRTTDSDQDWLQVPGDFVYVQEGVDFAHSRWQHISGTVIGTDDLLWEQLQFAGLPQREDGDGSDLVANVWTLAATPIPEILQVYWNGILLRETDDYTLSGADVTFLFTVEEFEKITAIYWV